MEKQSFDIFYNGKNVAVTKVDETTYSAQITYKPFYLQLHTDKDGTKKWCELPSNAETLLSKEIGSLIQQHLYSKK